MKRTTCTQTAITEGGAQEREAERKERQKTVTSGRGEIRNKNWVIPKWGMRRYQHYEKPELVF